MIRKRHKQLTQWVSLLAITIIYLIVAQPAFAQEIVTDILSQTSQATIQQMQVQVMPEFDDPRVLVIVQGRLNLEETAAGNLVTFRIPRGAQINQMSVMDIATGQTLSQQYTAQPDPNDERFSLVTYAVDQAHFFYEYYYNPVQGETDKQFTFEFNSLHNIDDLVIEIQEPLAATRFEIDPLPTIARFEEVFGFTYHQYSLGAVTAEKDVSLAVQYTKTDAAPSVSREQLSAVQSAPVISPNPAGGGASPAQPALTNTSTPFTIDLQTGLIIGAVLAALMGFIVWRYKNQNATLQTSSQTISHSVPSATPAPIIETQLAEQAQCSQCGVDLKADALFCHECGTPAQGSSQPQPVTKRSTPSLGAKIARAKSLRPVAVIIIALLFLGVIWSATNENRVSADDELDRTTMVAGAQVFVAYCTECHGARAEGNSGPALNSGGDAYRRSDKELKIIINQGQGEMPGLSDKLSPDQVDEVVYFMKRQWTAKQRQQQGALFK